MRSLNNRFILEPYVSGNKITTSNPGGGFAGISQKVQVKGLKLLVDFIGAVQGTVISLSAGATVYIEEELLFTQPWAKKLYECSSIEGKFIIVDAQFVDFYEEKLN